jgi:threonine/homoserine/homoserine lactone efflux protein
VETVRALVAVFALAAVGIMSPGPDFVVVSYTAMTGARRRAGWVASGVVVGNAMWATAAILGLSALLALAPTLFVVFKIAGAGYLMWLGIKLIRGARIPLPTEVVPGEASGTFASLAKGFMTTLANPKAAVFYASVLTAALPSSPPSGLVVGTVAGVVLVATVWFTIVVIVLSTARASSLFRRRKVWVETSFGSILAGFGLIRCLGAARELAAAWA